MKQSKQAFTLVELIVTITILAILGTIAFISLQGYSKQARDSRRISDMSNIKTALELFAIRTGKYPLPDTAYNVEYDSELVWTQGTIGDIVTKNLSRNLTKKTVDPLFDTEYIYSTTQSQKEYELLSLYEADITNLYLLDNTYAANKYNTKVDGNYIIINYLHNVLLFYKKV